MRNVIVFALANYSLTFLIIGFVAAAISLMRKNRGPMLEAVLSFNLLFALGFSLYNFVMHVFFQNVASHFIGWAPSPAPYSSFFVVKYNG
jgi:Family of unknown function (DUF6790)